MCVWSFGLGAVWPWKVFSPGSSLGCSVRDKERVTASSSWGRYFGSLSLRQTKNSDTGAVTLKPISPIKCMCAAANNNWSPLSFKHCRLDLSNFVECQIILCSFQNQAWLKCPGVEQFAAISPYLMQCIKSGPFSWQNLIVTDTVIFIFVFSPSDKSYLISSVTLV